MGEGHLFFSWCSLPWFFNIWMNATKGIECSTHPTVLEVGLWPSSLFAGRSCGFMTEELIFSFSVSYFSWDCPAAMGGRVEVRVNLSLPTPSKQQTPKWSYQCVKRGGFETLVVEGLCPLHSRCCKHYILCCLRGWPFFQPYFCLKVFLAAVDASSAMRCYTCGC